MVLHSLSGSSIVHHRVDVLEENARLGEVRIWLNKGESSLKIHGKSSEHKRFTVSTAWNFGWTSPLPW